MDKQKINTTFLANLKLFSVILKSTIPIRLDPTLTGFEVFTEHLRVVCVAPRHKYEKYCSAKKQVQKIKPPQWKSVITKSLSNNNQNITHDILNSSVSKMYGPGFPFNVPLF